MRRLLFFIIVSCVSIFPSYSQNIKIFTFKDSNGCVFELKQETVTDNNVVVVSAKNNKKPNLAIPSEVDYKNNTYKVVRIESKALSNCDNKLKTLVIPGSVRAIGGWLFGTGIKLMGGFFAASKGGSGGPLSGIRLESLKISADVKSIGDAAFVTGMSTKVDGGAIFLNAQIDELPFSVTAMTAKKYGLREEDVTEYWQRIGSDNAQIKASVFSKQEYLLELAQSPSRTRLQILNYFNGNDEVSVTVVSQLTKEMASKGITRDEYIAALNGYVDGVKVEQKTGIGEGGSLQGEPSITVQAIENSNFSIMPIVNMVVDSHDKDLLKLMEKLEKEDSKQKYANAIGTVTQMLKYKSDPLLLYVRAICEYKTGKYRKSKNDCLSAMQDGRLTLENKLNVNELLQVATNKYIARLDRISNVVEVVGNATTSAISSAMSPGATTNTIAPQTHRRINTVSASTKNTVSKRIKCSKCNGSGRCVCCNGTGKRTKHYKKNGQWHNTIECPHCDGSGYCSTCDGSKWIESGDIPSVSSASSSTSYSSSNNSNTSKTYRTCSWCNGSGKILKETEQQGFRLQGEKNGRCSECGAQLYKGKGHKHYKCTHCNGTGKLEN